MANCRKLAVILPILSVLLLCTPAEACRRYRLRHQCEIIYSPIASRVSEPVMCMYCDGALWQEASADQTCVMLPQSKLLTSCGRVPPDGEKKGGAKDLRVLHGCGLYYCRCDCRYHWCSDINSSSYCDTTYHWRSRRVAAFWPKGRCHNGQLAYDIMVSD